MFKIVKNDKDKKEIETYWELILVLLENVNENNLINFFTNLEDIIDWLKKYDFDLNSTENKEVSIYEGKIKLVNKTLLINKIKTIFKNCSEKSKFEKIIEKKESPIYPHKTGLQNLGYTSYMNSAIQCLSNIKYLSDYLINHYGKFDFRGQPLSTAFSSLVYDLFTTEKKYIIPELFKKIIGKLNPSFEGMHEADPKYLLIFLLGKLHPELNKCNYLDQIKIDLTQLEKDSFDENKAFQNFIKDYKEKNRSIISDTFYGTIRSTMKCNHCRKIKYTFQIFNLLIFQLKNVKEYNKKRFNNNYNYTLNIYDAFDFNKKEESLEIYCKNCKGLKPGTHHKNIFSLPKVLIIILNRGINNKDFNDEFIFPEKLDLSFENFVIKNAFYTHFYLQSVIKNLGEPNDHFITYCRNGPQEDFICYNDSEVSKATVKEAMSSNINGKKIPYILVYHHMN